LISILWILFCFVLFVFLFRFAEPLQHFRQISNFEVATSVQHSLFYSLWHPYSNQQIIPKSFVIFFCRLLNLRHWKLLSLPNFISPIFGICKYTLIIILFKKVATNNVFDTNSLFLRFDSLPKSLSVLQIPTQSGVLKLDHPHIVNAIHNLNLKVHYWVVNNPFEIAHLIEMGSDGIITDRSDIASELRRRYLLGQPMIDNHTPFSLTYPSIEKSYINSSDGFFIPEYIEPEIHTCVSFLCRIFQNVYYYFFSFIGMFIFVLILFWKCK
jgi:hypothetical protein